LHSARKGLKKILNGLFGGFPIMLYKYNDRHELSQGLSNTNFAVFPTTFNFLIWRQDLFPKSTNQPISLQQRRNVAVPMDQSCFSQSLQQSKKTFPILITTANKAYLQPHLGSSMQGRALILKATDWEESTSKCLESRILIGWSVTEAHSIRAHPIAPPLATVSFPPDKGMVELEAQWFANRRYAALSMKDMLLRASSSSSSSSSSSGHADKDHSNADCDEIVAEDYQVLRELVAAFLVQDAHA